MRDQRTISQVLERLLNSTVDGRNLRILEMTRKLQILQPIAAPIVEEGKIKPAKDSHVYVGSTPYPSRRLGMNEDEKKKRNKIIGKK